MNSQIRARPAGVRKPKQSASKAADWVDKLPAKASAAAGPREWFEAETAWKPPQVCTKLSGPWAAGSMPRRRN